MYYLLLKLYNNNFISIKYTTIRISQHRIKMISRSTFIFLLILLSSDVKGHGHRGHKGGQPQKNEKRAEIKELETRITEQIVQEVSKLKADLSENLGILKAARTRLMNDIEALKSDNRNQTMRIGKLEDLLLKGNKTDSTTDSSISPTTIQP